MTEPAQITSATGDQGPANIQKIVPVLGITSYNQAVAFYVDWLGFNLDWEWRAAPGSPVIMAISRDSAEIMLNEDFEGSLGASLLLRVEGLQALADEWNQKRPDSVEVTAQPPYDIPAVYHKDPFGNLLEFQQPVSDAQKEAWQHRGALMRQYISRQLAGGNPCPTPETVVEAIGGPIGLAMDVLGEFPEYNRPPRPDAA